MFVASYDDRHVLPYYFPVFIEHSSAHASLSIITPARVILEESGSLCNLHTSNHLCLVRPSTLPQFQETVKAFEAVFTNHSTNSREFEKACFIRWFALNLATKDLSDDDYVCLLDSDFILGVSPEKIVQLCLAQARTRDVDVIAYAGDSGVICPEMTILKKKALFRFCRFLFSEYFSPKRWSCLRGKWFDAVGNGFPGGVCDMHALASWIELERVKLFDLASLEKMIIIDNFESFFRSRIDLRLDWHISVDANGQYLEDSKGVKSLIGIHFQGDSKKYIPLLRGLGASRLSLSCSSIGCKADRKFDFFERKIYGGLLKFSNKIASYL